MGLTIAAPLDPHKYAKLLAKSLPKVPATPAEAARLEEQLEALYIPERELSAEEEALTELLQTLIQNYDEKHHPPKDLPPHKAVLYLMEQRHLRQADLIEMLGSSAQVSDMVTGKRAISKAQAKKLAGFFRVSAELFI